MSIEHKAIQLVDVVTVYLAADSCWHELKQPYIMIQVTQSFLDKLMLIRRKCNFVTNSGKGCNLTNAGGESLYLYFTNECFQAEGFYLSCENSGTISGFIPYKKFKEKLVTANTEGQSTIYFNIDSQKVDEYISAKPLVYCGDKLPGHNITCRKQ